MAAIIFTGAVLNQTLRVVDIGVGSHPRLVVESQQLPDAMGARGWVMVDPIPQPMFEALLIASHVVA